MSKKPETLFSNQLIKNLNKVFWTRIENKHGGGVPDLYGTYNNKSAFLELKIKTKQNNVLISSSSNILELSNTFNKIL
jgi:hypothetical protein